MGYTPQEIREYLTKTCCQGCKDGSFEQAYHKLQKAPSGMDDSLLMFEAGKLAAKTERNFEINSKVQKAIGKAIKETLS